MQIDEMQNLQQAEFTQDMDPEDDAALEEELGDATADQMGSSFMSSGGALTVYHGTDSGSAADILENGFNMNRAAELAGTGDLLWTTTSPTDAGWFADTNPAGGEPAVLQITVPNSVINNLTNANLLSVEGPVYKFQPGAMNTLNSNATVNLVKQP